MDDKELEDKVDRIIQTQEDHISYGGDEDDEGNLDSGNLDRDELKKDIVTLVKESRVGWVKISKLTDWAILSKLVLAFYDNVSFERNPRRCRCTIRLNELKATDALVTALKSSLDKIVAPDKEKAFKRYRGACGCCGETQRLVGRFTVTTGVDRVARRINKQVIDCCLFCAHRCKIGSPFTAPCVKTGKTRYA